MGFFNHAFSFGLEVVSEDSSAEDVSGSDLRRAILRRVLTMSDEDIKQACDGGAPFDSMDAEFSSISEPQVVSGVVGDAVLCDASRERLVESGDADDLERISDQGEIALFGRRLRELGCAVSIFTPEELGEASLSSVQDRMIERGWDAIHDS